MAESHCPIAGGKRNGVGVRGMRYHHVRDISCAGQRVMGHGRDARLGRVALSGIAIPGRDLIRVTGCRRSGGRSMAAAVVEL